MPNYWLCLLSSALICFLFLFPKKLISTKIKFLLFILLSILLTAWGFITTAGIGMLSIAGLTMYLATRPDIHYILRFCSALIAIACVFIISMNIIPGFVKFSLITPEYLGAATMPFKADISFAKCMTGLLLLLFWIKPEFNIKDIATKIRQALPFIIGLPVLILFLAQQLGWRFDFKWYDFSLAFIIGKLFLGAAAEEIFFRGVLQCRLNVFLQKHTTYSAAIALLSISLLFGILHLGGGTTYAILAATAGLAYGWIYWRFNSLHAAIGCHLLLNSLHFIFLTYPA